MSSTPHLDKILALSAGGKLKAALGKLDKRRKPFSVESPFDSEFGRKPTPGRDRAFGPRETPPAPRGGLTWDTWRAQQGGPGGFDNMDPVAYGEHGVDREMGGRTRDYTRVERGREEHVSGHVQQEAARWTVARLRAAIHGAEPEPSPEVAREILRRGV